MKNKIILNLNWKYWPTSACQVGQSTEDGLVDIVDDLQHTPHQWPTCQVGQSTEGGLVNVVDDLQHTPHQWPTGQVGQRAKDCLINVVDDFQHTPHQWPTGQVGKRATDGLVNVVEVRGQQIIDLPVPARSARELKMLSSVLLRISSLLSSRM